MTIKKGDLVTRNSYNNDIVFKVIKIVDEVYYLKGEEVRLFADSNLEDLQIYGKEVKHDDGEKLNNLSEDRDDYFYLPGKVLHLDGDDEYLKRCMDFYNKNRILAIGKKINEEEMPKNIVKLLKEYKPDIVVITGHDAYYFKNGDKENLNNYRNSSNFIKTVSAAREYEKSHEKLVIIAGACQSNYEKLIKSGANFASSPKRINIHALDPAIIAVTVSLTNRNAEIDLLDLLSKTKYGKDGMGGLICNGVMYVGFPR